MIESIHLTSNLTVTGVKVSIKEAGDEFITITHLVGIKRDSKWRDIFILTLIGTCTPVTYEEYSVLGIRCVIFIGVKASLSAIKL